MFFLSNVDNDDSNEYMLCGYYCVVMHHRLHRRQHDLWLLQAYVFEVLRTNQPASPSRSLHHRNQLAIDRPNHLHHPLCKCPYDHKGIQSTRHKSQLLFDDLLLPPFRWRVDRVTSSLYVVHKPTSFPVQLFLRVVKSE